MADPATSDQIADYERRYRQLAGELAHIGFIRNGSLTRRYTTCATAGCRCHHDPPQPHGPYYQWSAKRDGKTVTKRLNPAQAALYQEWIANDRRARTLLAEMRKIAEQAGDLLLTQTPTDPDV